MVGRFITELGVFDIVPSKRMFVRDLAPGVIFREAQEKTEANLFAI